MYIQHEAGNQGQAPVFQTIEQLGVINESEYPTAATLKAALQRVQLLEVPNA